MRDPRWLDAQWRARTGRAPVGRRATGAVCTTCSPSTATCRCTSNWRARKASRVLEVACGSGRVLVPLVRAGFDVVGIDISPHMLALARAKLDAGATPARLIQADMRDFRLETHGFRSGDLGGQKPRVSHRARRPAALPPNDRRAPQARRTAGDRLPASAAGLARRRTRLDARRPAPASARARLHAVARRVGREHRPGPAGARDPLRVRGDRRSRGGGDQTVRRMAVPLDASVRSRASARARAALWSRALYGGYQREPFTSNSPAMVFLARCSPQGHR